MNGHDIMEGSPFLMATEEPVKPTAASPPLFTAAGNQVSAQFATLITNAFGLVAALAWSDAIKKLFERGGPMAGMPYTGPFTYAILVTLLAYGVSVTLGKLVKSECTKLCDADQSRSPASPSTSGGGRTKST